MFVTCKVQKPGLFYIFISKVGGILRHTYVKIFLKFSVGFFQKNFAIFLKHSSRKNCVS